MKIHKILDAQADQECIESFDDGSIVNIETISVGAQIYYLYKDEDDSTNLQWYWGCVIEINPKRKKGEYYHIWHDDEEPWIDLTKDRHDWKLIPQNSSFYDGDFMADFAKLNAKKKRKHKKKRKKSKKSKSSAKSNSTKKQRRYGVGNQGFVLIIPKMQMSCTITAGPVLCGAVRLESTCSNRYTFWVRRQDIKQVLEEQKLEGQRVAFELNGKTSRYKVVAEGECKEFVQCFWSNEVNQTWIDMDDFHTKLASVSLSDTDSPTPHIESTSNKENESDSLHSKTPRRVKSTTRNSNNSRQKSPGLLVTTSEDEDAEMNGSVHLRKPRGRPKGKQSNKSISRKPVRSKPKDFADSTSTITTTTTPSISVSLSTISTVKSESGGGSGGRSKSHRKVQKHRKSKKSNSKLAPNGTLNLTVNPNPNTNGTAHGTSTNGTNSTTSSVSQQLNRSTESIPNQRRNVRTASLSQRQSNTIHSGQVSSDLVRYQRLQNQRFNQQHTVNTSSSVSNGTGNGSHSNRSHNHNHNHSHSHSNAATTAAALNALNAAVNSHRTNLHLQSLSNRYLNSVNCNALSPANLLRQQSSGQTLNHQNVNVQNLQNVLSSASLTSPCYVQLQASQPHYIASYPTNHQRTGHNGHSGGGGNNGNAFTAVSSVSGPSPLNNRTVGHYPVTASSYSYSQHQQQQQQQQQRQQSYAHSVHSGHSRSHSTHSQPISRRNGNGNMVSGHKRQRPADSVSNGLLPLSKRQKVNNGKGTPRSQHSGNQHSQHNQQSTLQLVAIQPPQPENVKMPELQPSATPKAKETKVITNNRNGTAVATGNGNGNGSGGSDKSPFPNPSVSSMSSPADTGRQREEEEDVKMDGNDGNRSSSSDDALDGDRKKKQYPTADDVSSIASMASGAHSESPKVNVHSVNSVNASNGVNAQNLRGKGTSKPIEIGKESQSTQSESVCMNIGVDVDLDEEDGSNHIANCSTTTHVDLVSPPTVNQVDSRADSLSDTESEGDNEMIQRSPPRMSDSNHNSKRGRKKRSDHRFSGYDRSHFVSSTQRQFLSEPPPATSCSLRYQMGSRSCSSWYGFHAKQQRCLVPMRLPVEHITNKVTDKNLSPRERIEWLKSMIKYLTNCKKTMTQMCGQINSECQKVILCVEGIIQDLEQHQKC